VGRQQVILLDTHALVWWVSDAAKLSGPARRAIQASIREDGLAVSAISLFEISTLVRRKRLQLGVRLEDWLGDLGRLPELRIEPLGSEIARLAGSLDESFPGDPADRIIAATAVLLRVRLVSADARLRRASQLQVVW
jgi:PIN domain nuclease of toxin-antitoxin system